MKRFETDVQLKTLAGAFNRPVLAAPDGKLVVGAAALPTNTLFKQYTQTLLINTATETSMLSGSYLGSKTIPAGSFAVGRILRIRVFGTLMTNAASQTIYGKLEIGAAATIPWGAGGATLPNLSLNNCAFRAEADLVCRSLGVSGQFYVNGIGLYVDGSTAIPATRALDYHGGTGAVFDTTVDNAVDIKFKWGAASGTNQLAVDTVTCEWA